MLCDIIYDICSFCVVLFFKNFNVCEVYEINSYYYILVFSTYWYFIWYLTPKNTQEKSHVQGERKKKNLDKEERRYLVICVWSCFILLYTCYASWFFCSRYFSEIFVLVIFGIYYLLLKINFLICSLCVKLIHSGLFIWCLLFSSYIVCILRCLIVCRI